MQVLFLGLMPVTAAELTQSATTVGVAEIGRADRLGDVKPPYDGLACLFVGSQAAAGGWAAFEELARREVPGVTLVAVPDPGDETTVFGGWDDVLLPDERDERTLKRVVRLALRLAAAVDQVSRYALRDPLTDVLNRRGLERALFREGSARDRGKGPLSVILIDVDDFKQINDDLGMVGGDRVLRAVAAAIQGAVRQGDSVARVGGDEFLVVLPGARTWEAVEVAERIRLSVADLGPANERVTVSSGVRRLGAAHSLEQLLQGTQSGLKASKRSGKNQVHLAGAKGTRTSLSEAHSMPPQVPLHQFRDRKLIDLRTGVMLGIDRAVDVDGELALELSLQRAVHPAWDLHWLSMAIRGGMAPGTDLHVRLYPPTFVAVDEARMAEAIGAQTDLRHLVIAIDEQFLSGDPSQIGVGLRSIRRQGVRLCLDVSDFGQACLEGLVVLRPERVMLTAEVIGAAVASRSRRAALVRFARVVHGLELDLLASGIDDAAALELAMQIDVTIGSGSHVPRTPTQR